MRKQNELLQKIIMQFGTPLYIYDNKIIQKKYEVLKNNFSSVVDVFYSLKANPNIAVAAELNKLGAGVEVCSGAELEAALLAGFQPENIIFVGPVKSVSAILRALELQIYAIVCESTEEFSLINELAKTRSVVADVAIRINPGFTVRGASLKMGGIPSQFGIDQQDVFDNKKFFLGAKNINLLGIHIFNGTRILRAETLIENVENILSLAERLEQAWGINFSMLDVGGGIGVPYFSHEEPFDFTKIGAEKFSALQDYKKRYPMTRLILESGRYLVADAGIFVTRIESVKESQGKIFLITDGGMNCHLTAAGYGSIIRRNFPIKLLNETNAEEIIHYQITGPLCTPADVIARDIPLAEAKQGDYVIIEASGAYGPTASPVLFLGHGHPAEVLIKDHTAHLVRERDSIHDLLRNQKNFSSLH